MNFRLNAQERPWFISSFIIATLIGLPIVAVAYLALFPEENAWPHLLNTVLPSYLKNTLILMLGVGSLTFLVGTGSAWLISMYDFPGKKWLSWALLLPFAVPAYVIAYTYTDFLEYAGPVQSALRELFGWKTSRDYWFPEIRSMGGAIIMMSLVLYPYVYMLARAAFLEQSISLYRISRSLGSTPFQFFYRVSLPIARPAIAVGLSLVLMETLNDFGTVDYFAVQTLTAGLYDTWLNMGNLGGAAQIALLMMAVVVILISSERYSRRRQKQYQSRNQGSTIPSHKLYGIRAYLAFAVAFLPVLLGFLFPFSLLTIYAVKYFEISWHSNFIEYALNSFVLASIAAFATLVLGIVLTYSKRLNSNKLTQHLVNFSSLGYAIPGAVLAIGIIIPFAAFDNTLDGLMREHFDFSTGLILSGTAFAIVFSYSVRFLAVSSGSVESSLSKVTPSMDMASRSLGHNYLSTLFKVHLPIIKRGALTGMLVVFVDCLKELPATLILRPFNFETLATQVYQFASDELLEQSALSALIIVAVGILPVILLDKSISQKS
ncbi:MULTISPECIES: iron ABC transporter permease [unclassified Oleiphilus]|nr:MULTISPECIES: iron ABC transporter permease [unclassified Oleiphilus]KZY51034.1 iron ABC transporter permease [Oleiphilus sp. HI0050]KZY74180.1 iron ABC transporter permease [Oleiphilus sp. HI0068]KZY79819.1 iron ABC transporter permease [Oleiphilus sp. HI0069]KZZ09260.1 iron ABC transporter permease [Oleiphilus sp. HI0078]KZZ21666.1 iron ABC transporter permease [Oleiphilus sp. HI0081]KZZ45943.1 iron ABC transporter permease [Oleiphilus sp. HI0085]